MYKLVLLRHGESNWNKENKFTGWTDVDLSEKGVAEAHDGAKDFMKEGFTFDIAFTSVLKRAIRTLWIVQDDMDLRLLTRLRMIQVMLTNLPTGSKFILIMMKAVIKRKTKIMTALLLLKTPTAKQIGAK